MKHLAFLMAVLLVMLYSCTSGEDKVKVPDNIIHPDSMVKVLVDFQLAEAALQVKQQERKEPRKYIGLYYSFIFKKHDINREDLDNSLQFYSGHPKLLQEIYEKVLTELSTRQSKTLQ
jgi:hypothetical protein